SGTVSYQYDGENHQAAVTQAGALITHFFYNYAGDLVQKQLPTGTIVITYGTTSSAVPNAVGRVISVQDAGGTLALKYDSAGRVSERRRTALGSTYVTGYAYDSLGRLRQLTYPDGYQINYYFDSTG